MKTKKDKAPKAKRPAVRKPRYMACGELTVDPGIQMRAGGIVEERVALYMEALDRGDRFPAVRAFDDGEKKWLSSGFHREAAHRRKSKPLLVDLRKGSRADAILDACGANADHGLDRTADDKRRAIDVLLSEYPKKSDRWIAEAAKVSPTTVGTRRQELKEASAAQLSNLDSQPPKREGKDGVERTLPARAKKEALPEPDQAAQPGAIVAPQAWLPAAEPVTAEPTASAAPAAEAAVVDEAVVDEAVADEEPAPVVPTYGGLFPGSPLAGIPLRQRGTAPAEPTAKNIDPIEETIAEVLGLDAADGGQWVMGEVVDGTANIYGLSNGDDDGPHVADRVPRALAELIVTYRDAAPVLAHEVRRLQAELARLREQAAVQALNRSLDLSAAGLVTCEGGQDGDLDACGELVPRPKQGAALCERHKASQSKELTVVREEQPEPEDRDVELADRDVPPQARVCEGPGCSKALDEQSKARYCSNTCRGRASKSASKAKAGA